MSRESVCSTAESRGGIPGCAVLHPGYSLAGAAEDDDAPSPFPNPSSSSRFSSCLRCWSSSSIEAPGIFSRSSSPQVSFASRMTSFAWGFCRRMLQPSAEAAPMPVEYQQYGEIFPRQPPTRAAAVDRLLGRFARLDQHEQGRMLPQSLLSFQLCYGTVQKQLEHFPTKKMKLRSCYSALQSPKPGA
jgi:hypothetical protein